MATRRRPTRDTGSSGNTGCLLWLAGVIVIAFLFALSWPEIQATLQRTKIVETIRDRKFGDKKKNPVTPAPKIAPEPGTETPGQSLPPGMQLPGSTTATTVLPGPLMSPRDPNSTTTLPAAETSTTLALPRRPVKLYFVRIDDDGIISRQEVTREIPMTSSPLLDALGALMKGPSEEELRRKLVSLIPLNSRLLSVKIQGSTAVLNFNEAFMYNRFGIEGYAAQLKQVVYTATTFPTVQDVQILIEGETRDYLGGEGVFIGRPLSRNSF